MSEYLEAIQRVIKCLHGAESTHVESVPILETFKGEVAWNGTVEVFRLTGHPEARRCYGWGYPVEGDQVRYVAVLGVPPATSPIMAVRTFLASEAEDLANGSARDR